MITEILPSAFAAVGSSQFRDSLGLATRLGPARRVVVLLVDGLGYHLLPRSDELAAAASMGTLDALSCTMPSTTPTSLVSLGTGAQPGAHGIVGFTVNLPGTDRVLTHIYWGDDPDPSLWQPIASTFARAGVPSAVVQPAAFVGSGLSRAAYGGATFVGVRPDDDLVDAVLRVLPDNNLVYAYTSVLDTAAHVHGIDSRQWRSAGADVATIIERLTDGLPSDTALLVTADHGGLDVPAANRVDIDSDDQLAAGLRVIAGEPRLRYLHTVDGARDDVLATWRSVLGESADVLARDEAIATGMFGDVTATNAERLGDVVVICLSDNAILATAHEPPEVTQLVGMHGAATAVETAIPLLSYRHG